MARMILMSQGKAYHGSSSDIWSCGIILFALLTGRLPFDDDNIRSLLQKVKIGVFEMPDEIKGSARDLLKGMLEKDPEKRITVSPR
jgi:serine/threonine protein kinase